MPIPIGAKVFLTFLMFFLLGFSFTFPGLSEKVFNLGLVIIGCSLAFGFVSVLYFLWI